MANQTRVIRPIKVLKNKLIKYPSNHWLILGIFFTIISCQKPVLEVDYLIQGALVFNGENQEPTYSDVGILGDKLVFVGDATNFSFTSGRIIDARGLYLSPGFIDPHTHLDRDLSDPDKNKRANLSALRQGVTTIISGNDGGSPIPIGRKLEEWERNGVGTNVGLFVGHGSVRRLVVGLEAVQPTVEQLEEMKSIVAKSMEDGAFGLSTGLFYATTLGSNRIRRLIRSPPQIRFFCQKNQGLRRGSELVFPAICHSSIIRKYRQDFRDNG